MKRLLVLLFWSSGTLFAQSPFDGTWIIKSDTTQLPEKPEVYVLSKGMFRCLTCVPRIEIKADGHDQNVTGSSYSTRRAFESWMLTRLNSSLRKPDKRCSRKLTRFSPDGGTLTQTLKDTTEAQPVTIETISQRVARQQPAGYHALSGSWHAYKINRSKNGSTIKYKCTTDGFSAETPLGEKFDAKFDGDYPVEDDPGHTMVSVKLLSPETVEVTSKRNGKVVGILHMSVAPDGKSIHVNFENKEGNTTTTYEMEKQP